MAPNIGQGSSTTPDRGYELFITATVMVIIAGLFVVTRVAVRLTSNKLGTDDYVIMLSLVFSVLLTVTINLAVVNGYGKHKHDLTHQQLIKSLRWFYFAQIFYKLVLGLNKVSILCLYLRIFVSNVFRWLCFANLFVVIGWTMGSLFATIFQCVPAAAFWDKGIKHPHCTDSTAFWYAYCIINILTDASILALPIREVSKLQLPRREKMGLILVFLLGAFVTATSIIKTNTVADTTKNQADITWSFIARSTWTLIEANTGIICACLPLLKRPLTLLFPYLFRRGTSANGGKSSSADPSQNSYKLDSGLAKQIYAYPKGTTTSTKITAGHRGKNKSRSQTVDSEEDMLSPEHGQLAGITRKTDFTIAYQRDGAESLSSLPETHSAEANV